MGIVEKVLDTLWTSDISAHLPGMKEGICKEAYSVVKDMGQEATSGRYVGNSYLEILVYVPKNKYSQMETYKQEIKRALKDSNYLKRTGREQPVIFLKEVEGYMSSIEYQINKII